MRCHDRRTRKIGCHLIHSLRLSVERRLISHVSAGVEQHRQSGLGNLLIKRVNGSVIDMERLILGMELDPLQPQLNNLRHNGLIIGRKRINRTEAEQAVVFLHLCRPRIDRGILTFLRRNRHHHRQIDAGIGCRADQPAHSPVVIVSDAAALGQLPHSTFGQRVGITMGMKINDAHENPFFLKTAWNPSTRRCG